MSEDIKIEFGKKYRDKVLGTQGIATAHCRYISGCDHVLLAWNKDGEVKDQWVDIVRLEEVEEKPVEVEKDFGRGGPASHPPKI